MKIQLWQQFSSNHSASFIVVGKFESPQDAASAAQELSKIALDIKQTRPLPSPDDTFYEPTETELDIGRRYGISWEYGLDWAITDWSDPAEFITVYQDTVWLRNPHWLTWQGPQPIDQIMSKLGALQVAVEAEDCRFPPVYPDHYALCDISFMAESEAAANQLFNRFKAEFDTWRLSVEQELPIDRYEESLLGLPLDWWYILKYEQNNHGLRVFEVEQDGRLVRLVGVSLSSDTGEALALQHIVDFLRSEGCTEIVYTFRSEPRSERRFDEDVLTQTMKTSPAKLPALLRNVKLLIHTVYNRLKKSNFLLF